MATLSQYSHPSLGLGNIAQPRVVELIDRIGGCESRIDASKEKMNAAMAFKQSLTMTLNELLEMGIDVASVAEKIKQLDEAIIQVANEYVEVKVSNEETISELKMELSNIPSAQMPESPVDMQASRLKSQPLSADSLKLDSQYFSFAGNLQEDKLASIEKFIRSSTGGAASQSKELSQSVCSQISNQIENHNISGTLIITVNCTHRNVKVFAPLILDPDRAVNAWNSIYEDKIDTSDPKSVRSVLSNHAENSLPLITGAVYGSSFIGMAHLLRSESDTMGDLDKLKAQLDNKLRAGGWLANATGDVGVDQTMLDEVKAFLSSNSVSCHVSVVSMGAIPTVKSNELNVSANKMVQSGNVAFAGDAGGTAADSVNSEALQARQNALTNTLHNARIKSILGAVSKSDDVKNSMLDLKSLVEALDNYVKIITAKEAEAGVPIGFYIRKIAKSDIAKMWLDKYYPAKK